MFAWIHGPAIACLGMMVVDNRPAPVATHPSRGARDFARRDGHHIAVVMVVRRDAVLFLRQLADAGQGQFVNDVGGQSILTSILLAILD